MNRFSQEVPSGSKHQEFTPAAPLTVSIAHEVFMAFDSDLVCYKHTWTLRTETDLHREEAPGFMGNVSFQAGTVQQP